MRKDASVLRDRVLAVIEIVTLGIWVGALAGFAFIFAPQAFRLIAPLDVVRFAALTAHSLAALTQWGYALGGAAVLTAVLRSISAGERTWDFIRALLVAVAIGLASFEQHAIVPAMTAVADVRSPEYRALHGESTAIYGTALLLALAALGLAAARRDD